MNLSIMVRSLSSEEVDIPNTGPGKWEQSMSPEKLVSNMVSTLARPCTDAFNFAVSIPSERPKSKIALPSASPPTVPVSLIMLKPPESNLEEVALIISNI